MKNYFITNRWLINDFTKKTYYGEDDFLSLKEIPQSIPVDFNLEFNDPAISPSFGYFEKDSFFVMREKQFFEKVMLNEPGKNDGNVLLYFHGYNVLPKNCINHVNIFRKHLPENTIIISIIWPCDKDQFGFLRDYWDDSISADISGYSFARVFMKFLKFQSNNSEKCYRRIFGLAHSMGNRVLRETFLNVEKYYLKEIPMIFKKLFLVAADMKYDSLCEGQNAHILTKLSKYVMNYYASDDFALLGSKLANLNKQVEGKRLGHDPKIDNSLNNITHIDCSDFNNAYDFPVGHSYFLNEMFLSNIRRNLNYHNKVDKCIK